MTEANKKKHRVTEPAQRRAEDLGVDLASVEGTGHEGQVTVDDVEREAHSRMESASSGPGNSGGGSNNGGGNNGDDGVAEAIKDASEQLTTDLQRLEQAVGKTEGETILDPDQQRIVNQYDSLAATLAGPTVIGTPEDPFGYSKLPLPAPGLPSDPRNFHPTSAPVKWDLGRPPYGYYPYQKK